MTDQKNFHGAPKSAGSHRTAFTPEEDQRNLGYGRYGNPVADHDEAVPTPKRRTRVWWFGLALVVALGGGYAWYQNQAVPAAPVAATVPASAVAASALEPVASAPAPTSAPAPEAADSVPAPASAPAEVPAPAVPEAVQTYTVEKGDWLSLVFPRDWKVVCALNELSNCSQIKPGQVLKLPEGVQATEKSIRTQKPQSEPVVKTESPKAPRAPKTNDAGEILYRIVGQAPLKGCGKRDVAGIAKEAWKVLGLSEEDQVYLTLNADLANGPRLNITEAEGRIDMPRGMRLEQVTFCRAGSVVARGPYRTDWVDGQGAVKGERFKLPSGKVLVWMRNCFNWVILPEEKTVFVPTPPIPEEPPIAALALPPEPPPPLATVTVAAIEETEPLCRLDPHAVLGQEHEPRHDGGDQADSSFLSAALYCTWRNASDTGTHGLGFALTASEWSGTVNQRAGRYEGTMHLAGPSYEFISDDGYDVTVSAPMTGKLQERFRQDLYRSERNFNLIGVSAGANFYQRRLAGEEWFPETQVFGTWAKPLSVAVAHSWDGQAITDTGELSRFGHYLNLGVRQWLYETPESVVLPYAQLGYFLETPSSESMSARLGISDPARIVGIGVGFDKDLQNGGDFVAAWGWWVDVVKGIQVGRSMYRKHQVITDAAKRGVTVEENHRGYIESIRFGDTFKDEAKQ